MSRANGWRTNADERGSSHDRRRRKAWMVTPGAGFGGDGTTVPCWQCNTRVTAKMVIPDRIIAGADGGTYRRTNIRPHCRLCSCRSGARRTNEILAASGTRRMAWLDGDGRYHGPITTNTAYPPVEECSDVPAWARH